MVYYTSLNTYLRSRFGCRVYKLSLSSGCTCPNRDGTLSDEGCIFCSAGGSGEFAAPVKLSLEMQLEYAREKVAFKSKNAKYIAYFSNYTNTYGNIGSLEKLYMQAIASPDIVALSIATRPDCLGDDVMDMLVRLNTIKPVWCELGLQTSNERTASYINRCYKNDVYTDAVKKLRAVGIEVVTHIILGLPGEGINDMLATVRFACTAGTNGIKLQLLHVLKGTRLAEEYKKGAFSTLSLNEYIDILEQCVREIPNDIVIHRLTGDGAKSLLIAPEWSADKKCALSKIHERIQPRQSPREDEYNSTHTISGGL